MILKIGLIALFIFFFAISLFAQNNEQIENELVLGIKDIQTFSIHGGEYDREKLSKAQKGFEEKLLKFTKVDSTLNYEFAKLRELMFIASSEDGKFRNYSWNLQDGGTMHHFARAYQYQGADGRVYSKTEKVVKEGMGPGFVTDIFTLDTPGSTVYIVCSTSIASTRLNLQSADLYKIEGGTLNDKVKLIKTSAGLTNTLNFEYDNFSVIDQKEPPSKLITFEEKSRTLKIPVVIKDTEYPDGRVTTKFISYRFNGKYFVKVS